MIRLGENNTTQMWFVNPHYERSGNTIYFKPSVFAGTDNCFYVRDKRYPSIAITRTKFWSDLSIQVPAVRFKVTSPLGVTDCIAINGLEHLLYDHTSNKIVLGSRDTFGDFTSLVSMNGDDIGVCVEDYIIRDQLIERKLRSEIAILATQAQTTSTYKIKKVAHRGFSTIAPENTLPAYLLAKSKGFDYVECDISFTSDGVPVLLHDETITRTSNGTGAISSMTLATAKTFDFGLWKNASYAGTRIHARGVLEVMQKPRSASLHGVQGYGSNNQVSRRVCGCVS